MFLSIDDHPVFKAFAHAALADLQEIQAHAAGIARSFTAWPEPLHEGGWSVYPMKWQGEVVDDRWWWLRHNRVVNAGYSRMAPGTVITPHVGYTSEVTRLHIGLDCPIGDCGIAVGEEVRHWGNGEVLLFDDTTEHHAWNRTNQHRVILLVDLLK